MVISICAFLDYWRDEYIQYYKMVLCQRAYVDHLDQPCTSGFRVSPQTYERYEKTLRRRLLKFHEPIGAIDLHNKQRIVNKTKDFASRCNLPKESYHEESSKSCPGMCELADECLLVVVSGLDAPNALVQSSSLNFVEVYAR